MQLQSELARAAHRIRAEVMVLLTGTPIQNNLGELGCLLNLLYPDVFSSPEKFEG